MMCIGMPKSGQSLSPLTVMATIVKASGQRFKAAWQMVVLCCAILLRRSGRICSKKLWQRARHMSAGQEQGARKYSKFARSEMISSFRFVPQFLDCNRILSEASISKNVLRGHHNTLPATSSVTWGSPFGQNAKLLPGLQRLARYCKDQPKGSEDADLQSYLGEALSEVRALQCLKALSMGWMQCTSQTDWVDPTPLGGACEEAHLFFK